MYNHARHISLHSSAPSLYFSCVFSSLYFYFLLSPHHIAHALVSLRTPAPPPPPPPFFFFFFFPPPPPLPSPLYLTGDLARWTIDGNVEYLGRKDHQVKIRGYRIELGEIESRLSAHDDISRAVVTVRRDSSGDGVLCAYLLPGENQEPTPAQLKEYLTATLPLYMVPTHIVLLEEFPITPTGKIDRLRLPEPGDLQPARYIAPSDPVETQLAQLWTRVLDTRAPIGLQSHFLRLGGHSLKAVTLASQVSKAFEVQFPLNTVFNHPTLGAMAAYIKGARKSIYQEIAPVPPQEYYPQSSAQKRLFFLDRFESIGTSYNMPMAVIIDGSIDIPRYQKAFQTLVHRHEALRTSFHIIDGQPVQQVHKQVDFQVSLEDTKFVQPGPPRRAAGGTVETEIDNALDSFVQPFELSTPPLLRVTLRSLAEQKWLLMADMHHIASDGTSMGLLIDDFVSLYQEEELPPLNLQYKDYAVWQNRLLEEGTLKQQEEYWLSLFSDFASLPRLDLPTDFPRPPVFTFEGERHTFSLEGEDALRLKQLCNRLGTTLYMTLLAVFNALLYKYTGRQDIIVGSGTAGRNHADLQGIIGMFVNMLALRLHPRGEKRFAQLVEEAREQALAAFESQDVQFEELVERLNPDRDPSRNPLFDVSFVVQNFRPAVREIKQEAVTFTPYQRPGRTSKFDLTLFAAEEAEGIHFLFEYYAALFQPQTIQRMSVHFLALVRQALHHPYARLADIDILSSEERRQVLHEFNGTDESYNIETTLPHLFEEQAKQTLHAAAVVSGTLRRPEVLTYDQLNRRANRLARYLREAKDIRAGDRVGILAESGADLAVGLWGILKAGAAYVPLNPSFPEQRLKHMIDDTQTGVVVGQERFIRILNRLQWECGSFYTFLCLDHRDIYAAEEREQSRLMEASLWDYVGETAVDAITGGGWLSSYTGEPFSQAEMDEYGDNVFNKVLPLLDSQSRVLEIGCASGLTMYRVAPQVGLYIGTDLSPVIIENNRKRVEQEGHKNIRLAALPAHGIGELGEKDFDLVIINSVIQCFHGHNYLRSVLRGAVDLLSDQGHLFVGDVMDLGLRDRMVLDLQEFKHRAAEEGNTHVKTKTDFSEELFLHRDFFRDLSREIVGVQDIVITPKQHTIANELTRFRYDVVLSLDKTRSLADAPPASKNKHQQDARVLDGYSDTDLEAAVGPDDAAYVIYTSGSTGVPRGVLVEHRGVVNTLLYRVREYGLGVGDTALQLFSNSFDGFVTSFFTPLVSGASVVLPAPGELKDIGLLKEHLLRNRVTHFIAVPALFRTLVSLLTPQEVARLHLKAVTLAGEAVPMALVEETRRRGICRELVNEYGVTEASVMSTLFRRQDRAGRVSIGRPVGNTRVYILDSFLQPQPVGVPGELCLSGPGVARGYLNRPELTADAFTTSVVPQSFNRSHRSYLSYPQARLYKTGDLARWLPDGAIEYLGRIDQQVKVRGFRIEPGEIEALLRRHPAINDAVVTAVEVGEGDLHLCAYIVPAGEEVDEGQVKEFLGRRLPPYMVPGFFVSLAALPLNPSGKVDRRALPAPGAVGRSGAGVSFRNETEEKLAALWADVLGIPAGSFGPDDDFFRLGGHSLKATLLTSRIHETFDVKVPLAEVFKLSTLGSLARYIRSAGVDVFSSLEVSEEREYYPVSFVQRRLYAIHRVNPESTGYNMPYVQVLAAGETPEPQRLEAVFHKMIRRHEVFRTSFFLVEGEPVQRVHDEVPFTLQQLDAGDRGYDELSAFVRPFDLGRAPLLRAAVIRLPGDKHVLLVDMHHIITDGFSLEVFSREFLALYFGEALAPLRIQYRDFARWQNSEEYFALWKRQEEFWTGQFSEPAPTSALPLDFPRPPVQRFEGRTFSRYLEEDVLQSLHALARETGATLYMVLLAVYTLFVSRLTGSDDVVIGTPVAGRRHADLEGIIGMFVNTLALRNYPVAGKTYLEFLHEVRERTVQAFDNQDYPFNELVSRVAGPRDAGRNPLFDVMFTLQTPVANPGTGADEEVEPADSEGDKEIYDQVMRIARFDLALFATEIGKRLMLTLEYSTALFKPQTMETFMDYLRDIITSVTQNPATPLEEIKIQHRLAATEKQVVEETFNF